MPRKKKEPVTTPALDLPKEFLEQLSPGPMDAAGVEAVFQKLKKAPALPVKHHRSVHMLDRTRQTAGSQPTHQRRQGTVIAASASRAASLSGADLSTTRTVRPLAAAGLMGGARIAPRPSSRQPLH
jgi:hypothetical protein